MQWWLFLLLAVRALHSTATPSAPVLLPKLQLRVQATTPTELQTAQTIRLPPYQPIQAVFSRPVIALDGTTHSAPFSLSCAELGHFRWVTTSIARFDPFEEWPADLECTFAWKPDLTSYDGVPLQLASSAPREVQFATNPLSMQVTQIFSESAANLTDSLWSATLGMPDDLLPEVPEDARIQVHFNSGVDLKLIRDALELFPAIPDLEIEVDPCDELDVEPLQQAAAARTTLRDEPSFPGRQDSSCAIVRLSKPLEDNTRYTLFLPVGTQYSSRSGVSKDTGVQMAGLRRFRLPLRADFQMLKDAREQAWDAISSRHLRAWLPHGLSSSTTKQQLLDQLSVCEVIDPFSKSSRTCKKLAVALVKSEARGAVTLHVPGLRAKNKYHLSVVGNMTVTDGFDLPLQASSASFWTQDAAAFFQGPSLGFGTVAVLGSKALPAGSRGPYWPFLARGGFGENRCRAAAWPINVLGQEGSQELAALMSNGGALEEAFSQVSASMASGASPSKLELALHPATKVHIIKEECSPVDDFDSRNAHQVLLLQADIMASILLSPSQKEMLVWVTHAGTLAQAGTVQGAHAYLYATSFQEMPTLQGSCTTNQEGLCSMALSDDVQPKASAQVMIVIGPNGDVLYLQAFHVMGEGDHFVSTSGALILDRTLVAPGESLHVTGFAQNRRSRGVPGPPNATLVVSPSWYRASQEEPIRVATTLSDLGSLHALIPVPGDATPGSYSIELLLQAPMPAEISSTAQQPAAQKQPLHRKLRYLLEQGAHKDVAVSLAASVPQPSLAKQGSFFSIAMESFVVADPRPPTAMLMLETPSWAKPSSPVPVGVRATSYLGNQLAGANVTVNWEAGSSEGTLYVITKDNGLAQFDVPLHTVPADKAPEAGENLRVTVQLIGPTREPITKTATIRLWTAAVRISMRRSLETDLPGVPFSPIVDVIDNEDDVSLKGTTVAVKLLPAELVGSSGDHVQGRCSEPQECSVISGDWLPQCRLALPCIGWYTLQACSGNSSSSCVSTKVGKNATEWGDNPLWGFDEPRLFTSASRFKLGSTAEFRLESPWVGDALVVWGNKLMSQPRTMHVKLDSPGRTHFNIPLGKECEGGCTVSAITAISSSPPAVECAPEGVPVSKLFDCHSPHTHYTEVHLDQEEDKQMDVALERADEKSSSDLQTHSTEWVFKPREIVHMRTKLTLHQQEVQDAEVTLIAVDKAILDLIPMPLRNLTAALQPTTLSSPLHSSSEENRVHTNAVDAVFDTLLRRLEQTPWLPLDTTVISSCCSPVDEDDDAYLAQLSSAITYMPDRFVCLGRTCPREFALSRFEEILAATSESMIADKSPEGGGNENNAGGTRLASDFVATPFFTVVRGRGDVSFNAPTKLGTFIIRAYAVARVGEELSYGQTEKELLVQRKLSLVPSMPRYVRLADSFYGGVLAAADTTDGDVSALIVCTVKGSGANKPLPFVMAGSSQTQSKIVSLTRQAEQAEVQFPFTAAALGTASVQCQAKIGDTVVDSLEMPLSVLPPQLPVDMATSFAVRLTDQESSSSSWEGLELPQALPGSGFLSLFAGLGNLASIRALTRVREAYHTGAALLLLAIEPLVLAKYRQPLESNLLQNASQAVVDLQRMTHAQFGLQAFPQETLGEAPTRTDIPLSAWACWMVSWVSSIDEAAVADQEEYSRAWKLLQDDLVPRWKAALERQVVADAEASRFPRFVTAKPRPYSDFYTLAWARLVLGAGWHIPLCTDKEQSPDAATELGGKPMDDRNKQLSSLCTKSTAVQEDLSLSRLKAQAAESGLASYILSALLINDCKECAAEHGGFVKEAADLLISLMRVAARTAYVSAGRDSQRSASYEVQALALQLLTQLSRKPEAALVQKLAAHVARQDSRQGSGITSMPVTPPVRARALMVMALASYDEVSSSDNPDLNVTISVAGTTLLEASFTPQLLSGHSVTNISWDRLPVTQERLAVKAEGSGEASLAAVLTFVPASPPESALYHGLWLESAVQEVDKEAFGPSLQEAPLGSIVSVSIQLVSPDDLGATYIRVLLPAGLEPLNPYLNDQQQACSVARSQWWQPTCPRQEVRPSEVGFLYSRLPAGTHTVSFIAIAAVRGDFVAPPVKAFVENQPEIFGLTAGSRFVVM